MAAHAEPADIVEEDDAGSTGRIDGLTQEPAHQRIEAARLIDREAAVGLTAEIVSAAGGDQRTAVEPIAGQNGDDGQGICAALRQGVEPVARGIAKAQHPAADPFRHREPRGAPNLLVAEGARVAARPCRAWRSRPGGVGPERRGQHGGRFPDVRYPDRVR